MFFRPVGVSAVGSTSSTKNKVKMGLHLYHKGCLDLRLVTIALSILKALPIDKLRSMEGLTAGVSTGEENISKLQKTYSRSGAEALTFFSALAAYMEAAQEVANKMVAGGAVTSSVAAHNVPAAVTAASGGSGHASPSVPGSPPSDVTTAGSGAGPTPSAAGGSSGAAGAGTIPTAPAISREQQMLLNAQIALWKLCTTRKRFANSGLFSTKAQTELKDMFDAVEAEIQRKKNR